PKWIGNTTRARDALEWGGACDQVVERRVVEARAPDIERVESIHVQRAAWPLDDENELIVFHVGRQCADQRDIAVTSFKHEIRDGELDSGRGPILHGLRGGDRGDESAEHG